MVVKMPKPKLHQFSLDKDGELDEVFIKNAFVHIERMNDRGYWIGIYPPDKSGLPKLMVNTGVHFGEWFFGLYEDSEDAKAQSFSTRRPRRGKAELPKGPRKAKR